MQSVVISRCRDGDSWLWFICGQALLRFRRHWPLSLAGLCARAALSLLTPLSPLLMLQLGMGPSWAASSWIRRMTSLCGRLRLISLDSLGRCSRGSLDLAWFLMAGPARRAVPALRSADVLDGDGSSAALDVPTDAIERSFHAVCPLCSADNILIMLIRATLQ